MSALDHKKRFRNIRKANRSLPQIKCLIGNENVYYND